MSRFSFSHDRLAEMDLRVVRLTAEDDQGQATTMAFSPDMGSNLFELKVGDTDYMYGVGQMRGESHMLGTPILYPTPNRVKNATFDFDGRTFKFVPNQGTLLLHGLVRDQVWEVAEPVVEKDKVSVRTWITFEPGKPYYEQFPVKNELSLTYTVTPGVVRMDWVVKNLDSQYRLPFGLGIHPFFRIIGTREQVRLLVPAKKWMEATELMPSGRLIDLEKGPGDLRTPKAISGLNLDDVFWGLHEAQPQVIYYDALGTKITLVADDFYTHSVVYTPTQAPFFCVENQSCSTDAHNLYAQGLREGINLTILDPGAKHESWIEIRIENQA